ncbi:MAG TPA: hypothetical protein VHB25_07720, partial [Gemmatimonadaceae bacterium]|nr:hypothetical protein [Gemmatimonadaceae bacterium]
MTPIPDDERFDELLQDMARDYNAPGSVPRDAMWARIAEARGEAHGNALKAVPVRTASATVIGDR